MLLLLATALAAELEQVRVFVGDRHAQLLLLADEAVAEPSVHTESRQPNRPAQAVVRLPGTDLDGKLEQAYAKDGDRWVIPVGQGGLERVLLEERSGGVWVTVELDLLRDASVTPVGDSGLLVDLRAPGADPDPSLPDSALLEKWLSGVSLTRNQEVSKPRKVVVIDPGHGGPPAPGAIGLTGTREADIALALSLRVAEEIKERADVDVVLTRTDDRHVSLDDRAAIANLVDLHSDTFDGVTAEDFHWRRKELEMNAFLATVRRCIDETFQCSEVAVFQTSVPVAHFHVFRHFIRNDRTVDNRRAVLQLAHLAQFDIGEFRVDRSAAPDHINVFQRRRMNCVRRMGRNIGMGHFVGRLLENPCAIDRHISDANHDDRVRVEVRL